MNRVHQSVLPSEAICVATRDRCALSPVGSDADDDAGVPTSGRTNVARIHVGRGFRWRFSGSMGSDRFLRVGMELSPFWSCSIQSRATGRGCPDAQGTKLVSGGRVPVWPELMPVSPSLVSTPLKYTMMAPVELMAIWNVPVALGLPNRGTSMKVTATV